MSKERNWVERLIINPDNIKVRVVIQTTYLQGLSEESDRGMKNEDILVE